MDKVANNAVISNPNHAIFTVADQAPVKAQPEGIIDAGSQQLERQGPVATVDTFEKTKAPGDPVKKTVFARMNESWFTKESTQTHAFFQNNPTDWDAYHATFREARKAWDATPADEMIQLYSGRSHAVIGDFGCGEGMIGAALNGQHTVHSFDHLAPSPHITACDIAHVPLDNNALDVAIFSLALMGKNFTQYIDEAHRTLKIGGRMHILEMTRRYTDREGFVKGLEARGFKVESVEDMWRFTHLTAIKTTEEIASTEPLVF